MKKSLKIAGILLVVCSIFGVYGLNYYEYSKNQNVERWRVQLKLSDLSAFFRYRTYNAQTEETGRYIDKNIIYFNDESPEQVLEEYIETRMRVNEVMNHYGYFDVMLHYLGLDYLAGMCFHPHQLTLDELNYIYQPLGVKYHVEEKNGEKIYAMDKVDKKLLSEKRRKYDMSIITFNNNLFTSDIDTSSHFDYDKFYEKYHAKYPLKNINHILLLDLSYHGIPYHIDIYVPIGAGANLGDPDGNELISIRIVHNIYWYISTINQQHSVWGIQF